MPVSEHEVVEARRLRNAARQVFQDQKDLVRTDLKAAGPGKRIATRLSQEGKYLAGEAADTASSHPQAVAAGGVALFAWLLGHPLIAAVAAAFGVKQAAGGEDGDDDDYDGYAYEETAYAEPVAEPVP